jgi:hypothetical protein
MVQLGEKHECDDCGIKVYDFGRPQALCPRCGRDLKSAQPKRKIEVAAPRARPEPVVVDVVEETPAEPDEIDDDLVVDEEIELVEGEVVEEEEEEVEIDDEE